MVDSCILQLAYYVLAFQKNYLTFDRFWRLFRRRSKVGRQFYRHSTLYHKVLKVCKLCIYLLISLLLRFINIVQFVQDDVKCLCQCVEMNHLRSLFVPAALDSKIRVYQNQRLYRKILEFQIPCRVVGRDVPYCRHLKSVITEISIIVMKIRYPLFFCLLAAVLADIMAGRSTGYQSQIYGNPCRLKLSCHKHRDIMHSAYVAKCVERGDIHPYTHKFIYVSVFYQPVQLDVLLGIAFRFYLSIAEKLHGFSRIELQIFFFIFVESSEYLQEEASSLTIIVAASNSTKLREQIRQNIVVAMLQPSFIWCFLQAIQIIRSCFHNSICVISSF